MPTKIDPQKIRTDLNTQVRLELNEETVAEYAELMQQNVTFPAILVYYDGSIGEYVLVDGFHRLAAHLRVCPNKPISAKVKSGTVDDARWVSIAANKDHGLRRTNADKHNAVVQALLHPKGGQMSNVMIASHAGVSETTVRRVRSELERSSTLSKMESRIVHRGNQIYTQKTAKTGGGNLHTCSKCEYFKQNETGRGCQYDSTLTEIVGTTAACDDFLIRYIAPSPRYLPPPDYDNIKEHVEKPKKKTQYRQNRNLRDSVQVCLPLDHPGLFAIELRNNFPEDYLKTCLPLLHDLLYDKEKDQDSIR